MENNNQNTLVLFGAGRIGRSFIAQLFSRGGFEIVFIDINNELIEELNRCGNYNLIIRGADEEVLNIKNVRGVFAGDEQKTVKEIANSRILAVSVGQNGLKHVIPLIAKGLIERYKINKESALDIIIAENLRNAADYFYSDLEKILPENYPLQEMVGLVETSIGKMVPIITAKDLEKDILQVIAEPYNTLILDKKGFINPIPEIEGLAPKEHMSAWFDRKLFLHNLGHASAAYLGYLYNPDFVYIYEALSIREIHNLVRNTMLQAADILLKKYPKEFTFKSLTDHIDDLLMRFQNKALRDTIFRVGCDLQRKLGPHDRLSGAIKLAIELKLPYDKILFALVSGCRFRAKDENGKMLEEDMDFANLYEQGIDYVLSGICEFDRILNNKIFEEAREIDRSLNSAK